MTNKEDAGDGAVTDKGSLIGKWFHSLEEQSDGCRLVQWQGRVLGRPSYGLCLIQLYDWVIGAESTQKLVKIEDMVGWSFYDSGEDMQTAFTQQLEPEHQAHAQHKVAGLKVVPDEG